MCITRTTIIVTTGKRRLLGARKYTNTRQYACQDESKKTLKNDPITEKAGMFVSDVWWEHSSAEQYLPL